MPLPNPDPLANLLRILRDPPGSPGLAAVPAESWEEIRGEADRHRLAGLLAHRLSGEHLPDGHKAWQMEVAAAHFVNHKQRLAALKSVAAALDFARIRYVSLKGPVLAERYWNPPYLKAAWDLDILIDEANLARASKCLTAIGLTAESHASWWLHKREFPHITFLPPDRRGTKVELHFRLKWQKAPPASATDFLDRSVRWTGSNGMQVQVLNPVDEAVFLAVRAATHSFSSLGWLYDALAVYRTLSAGQLARVVETARSSGQLARLAAANYAAGVFFAEPLIRDLAEVSVWRPTVAEIRREADWASLANHELPWTGRWQRRLLWWWHHCRMAGSPRNLIDVLDSLFLVPVLQRVVAPLYRGSAQP